MARARTDGAVEVRRLQMDEPLRPQGTVAPVFVPGAHKKPSTALADLARLIGNFKGYVESEEKKKKAVEDRQNELRTVNDYLTDRSGMTDEEFRAKYPNGAPEPVQTAYGGSRVAAYYEPKFTEFMAGEYDSYDPATDGDAAQFVRDRGLRFIEETPELRDNEDARGRFLDLMAEKASGASLEETKKRIEEANRTRLSGVDKLVDNALQQKDPNVYSAQERADAVMEEIRLGIEVGPRQGLRKDEVVQVLLRQAERARENGDPELVAALFETARKTDVGAWRLADQTQLKIGGRVLDATELQREWTTKATQLRDKKATEAQLAEDNLFTDKVGSGDHGWFRQRFIQEQQQGASEDRLNRLRTLQNNAYVQHQKIQEAEQKLFAHNMSIDTVKGQIKKAIRENRNPASLKANGQTLKIKSAKTGEDIDLPADQEERIIKQSIAEVAKEDVDQKFARAGIKPEDDPDRYNRAVDDQVHIELSRNGLKDENIEVHTANIAERVLGYQSGADMSQDAAILTKLTELYTENPEYAEGYLGGSEKNKTLFHEFRNMVNAGEDPVSAMTKAKEYLVHRDKTGGKDIVLSEKDFEDGWKAAKGSADSASDYPGGDTRSFSEWFAPSGVAGGKAAPVDPVLDERIKMEVRNNAQTLLRVNRGLTPKEAIKQTMDRMKRTHTIVNGALVPMGPEVRQGEAQHFQQALQARVDEVASKLTNGREDASLKSKDLMPVAVDGGAAYMLVDTRPGQSGVLVMDPGNPGMPMKIQRKDVLDGYFSRVEEAKAEANRQVIRKSFDERHGMSWAEELGFNYSAKVGTEKTRRDLSEVPEGIPSGVAMDRDFVAGTNWLEENLKLPKNSLWDLMDFETGGSFRPDQKGLADGKAVGLIQFREAAAKEMGYTMKELSGMSRVEQLKVTGKWLKSKLAGVENPTRSDVFMAVLYPAAVGKPDSHVLFKRGSKEYKLNDGLDLNRDGTVTKGEYASKVELHKEQHGRYDTGAHGDHAGAQEETDKPPSGGGRIVHSTTGEAFPSHYRSLEHDVKTKIQMLANLWNDQYGEPLKITPNGGRSRRASGSSQHVHGRAVDIYIGDMSAEQRTKLIEAALAYGATGIGGYGAGDGLNTVHIDFRKKKGRGPTGIATWWRHKPGVDSSWDTGPSWFKDGIILGSRRKTASN